MSELTDRLRELSRAAAAGNMGEFYMRIPAEPKRDADLVLDEAARLIESYESRLGTLQSERDGAFALIYELMRDEHFIHGRDSWFKRAHELCGDICTPGIHAFNSDDAELCQCGQRRADGSVVETQGKLCDCPHEGVCEYGPIDPRCARNWDGVERPEPLCGIKGCDLPRNHDGWCNLGPLSE